jgi:hypothetical protein
MFRVYAKRFALMMSLTCFVTLLQFSQPFLVLFLIDFIKNGPAGNSWSEMAPGVYLALGLALA